MLSAISTITRRETDTQREEVIGILTSRMVQGKGYAMEILFIVEPPSINTEGGESNVCVWIVEENSCKLVMVVE